MMDIDPLFASAHADLIYELEGNGFQEDEDGVWSGTIVHADGRSWPIKIDMRGAYSGYPTYPPSVKRTDRAPLTWHQNPDGSMCLYSQGQPGQFPWFRHGDLLNKATNWLVQADTNWSEEIRPDLDLERYWKRSSRYDLIIHSALAGHAVGAKLRFQRGPAPAILFQAGIPHPPAKRSKKRRNIYGLVIDVGQLFMPPRNWEALRNLIPNREQVESSVRSGHFQLLLVRYSRADHVGILGLAMSAPHGVVHAEAVNCAEWSEEITALRTGPHAKVLETNHIIIVGVGAVGSFIADGLFRSGARRLTMVDGDRLRPGNLIRHAASSEFVGLMKSEAMARTLGVEHKSITHRGEILSTTSDAREIIEAADLVIDATANHVATTLLCEAARDAGAQILTTYLANQGRSRVVTVHPSPEGTGVDVTDMTPLAEDGIEGGCGDPVSPTPPYAVQEVAAMACRKAVELLVRDTAQSEVRECP